jgi:hypothetical protein
VGELVELMLLEEGVENAGSQHKKTRLPICVPRSFPHPSELYACFRGRKSPQNTKKARTEADAIRLKQSLANDIAGLR